METILTTGSVGIRTTKDGNLVIGQAPIIRQHVAAEDADGKPIVSPTPILDMQPTVIDFAHLVDLMVEANDAGKRVEFLGHIVVRPSDPSTTFTLIGEDEC